MRVAQKNFKAGSYGWTQLGGAGNDNIASLRVHPGFQVVACLDDSPDVESACLLFTEGEYNNGALAGFGFSNQISHLAVVREATNPARIGQFGGVLNWPYAAIHMYLLIDGRVMFNDVRSDDDGNGQTDEYAIWNPANNQVVTESTFAPGSNLFCGAFVHLPNGNLLGVATGGGGNTVDTTMVYNTNSDRWTLLPPMQLARYYPSATVTAQGTVLVTGGNDIDLWTKQSPPQTPVPITVSEIYENGSFRLLPGAEFDFTNDHGPTNDASYWPWVQVAPNGRLFVSGPDTKMRWIDTNGNGNLDNISTRPDNAVRTYGSYATYTTGKQVIAGGGNSLASSYVIDFNGNTPKVSQVGNMKIGRRQFDMTIMADGTVFANGGNSDGAETYSGPGTIYLSEIFDPSSGQWSVADDAQRSRQYHSSAILIPDGRVVTAGQWTDGMNELNAEVFSPPYLFASDGSLAVRPTITSVPSNWAYGATVSVSYSTTGVAKAHLIKLGAVTHATNFEQRLVPLSIVSNSNGTINLKSPASGNIAPPGHYMLFLIRGNGVPSVAKIVRVGV